MIDYALYHIDLVRLEEGILFSFFSKPEGFFRLPVCKLHQIGLRIDVIIGLFLILHGFLVA